MAYVVLLLCKYCSQHAWFCKLSLCSAAMLSRASHVVQGSPHSCRGREDRSDAVQVPAQAEEDRQGTTVNVRSSLRLSRTQPGAGTGATKGNEVSCVGVRITITTHGFSHAVARPSRARSRSGALHANPCVSRRVEASPSPAQDIAIDTLQTGSSAAPPPGHARRAIAGCAT